MSDKPQTTKSFGQIAYEKHIEFFNFSHPRLGQKTSSWDELPENVKKEWEETAVTIIDVFCRKVRAHAPI